MWITYNNKTIDVEYIPVDQDLGYIKHTYVCISSKDVDDSNIHNVCALICNELAFMEVYSVEYDAYYKQQYKLSYKGTFKTNKGNYICILVPGEYIKVYYICG